MNKLSDAAQAVLDAFNSVPYYPGENDEGMLAAALRAAADQVVIKLAGLGQESAWCLEEIATELESH